MSRWLSKHHRRTIAAVSALGCAFGFVICGCETFSSDLAYLKEEILPPTPSEAATWMFDEYDPEKRRKGMVLISNAPFGADETYVKAYRLRVEEEKNPIVRATAVRALARHGGPEDATLIASKLEDESLQVRIEAAKGLQRLHDPEVVPAMLTSLRKESEDVEVKIALASALAQYPEDRVFQALIQNGLGAGELVLNTTAAESLRTLTGQDFADDPRAWLAWYRSSSAPFGGQQDYYYPTYHRDITWLEHLAFWTSKEWEQPQQPAGLRPDTSRTTYDDAPADESADG